MIGWFVLCVERIQTAESRIRVAHETLHALILDSFDQPAFCQRDLGVLSANFYEVGMAWRALAANAARPISSCKTPWGKRSPTPRTALPSEWRVALWRVWQRRAQQAQRPHPPSSTQTGGDAFEDDDVCVRLPKRSPPTAAPKITLSMIPATMTGSVLPPRPTKPMSLGCKMAIKPIAVLRSLMPVV